MSARKLFGRWRAAGPVALLIVLASLSLGARVNAQASPSTMGVWSPTINVPKFASEGAPGHGIHCILLVTGKVMFWNGLGEVHLWDPITGAFSEPAQPGWNIFCAGLTHLTHGRIFVAGGHVVNSVGLPHAGIYDPYQDRWTRLPDMTDPRWYPTTTTLANGKDVLVVAGNTDAPDHNSAVGELWQDDLGAWKRLTGAQQLQPLYPRMHLAPNGLVFNTGSNQLHRYWDTTGNGALTLVTACIFPNRSYGSSVMYDDGKILIAGGGDPPTETCEVINLFDPTPTWRPVAPMAFARRQVALTLLPDGKALMSGGSSGSGFTNPDFPVYTSEMWDPATETWSLMADQTSFRGYHQSGILLPDGRVISFAGQFGNDPNRFVGNFQLYSPPYLFKGRRPTITRLPANAPYGGTVFLQTPEAGLISRVTMLRPGAMTHAFDMDQRIVRLRFTPAAGGLHVVMPTDPNLAPPGDYMVFILNKNGVPSVAKWIHLDLLDTVPYLKVKTTGQTTINLTWTDNVTDKDGYKIDRSSDGANYTTIATVGPTVTTYTNTKLTPGTLYFYRVNAYSTASRSSVYSNSATAVSSPTPPAAPSNLAAAATSNSAIDLTWQDNAANEVGFNIEMSKDGVNFTVLTKVMVNTTEQLITNLSPNTTYYFRVRSYNTGGGSGYSNIASATTPN